jgi:hypothetical protein
LIPTAKFSYFVTFSASVLKRLWVNRTSISITSGFVLPIDEHYIWSVVEVFILSVMKPCPNTKSC